MEVVKEVIIKPKKIRKKATSKFLFFILICLEDHSHEHMLKRVGSAGSHKLQFEVKFKNKHSPDWTEKDISLFKDVDNLINKKRSKIRYEEACKNRFRANILKYFKEIKCVKVTPSVTMKTYEIEIIQLPPNVDEKKCKLRRQLLETRKNESISKNNNFNIGMISDTSTVMSPEGSCGMSQNKSFEMRQNESFEISPDGSCGMSPDESYGMSPDESYGMSPDKSYGMSQNKSFDMSLDRNFGMSQTKNVEMSQDRSFAMSQNRSFDMSLDRNFGKSQTKSVEMSQDRSFAMSQNENFETGPSLKMSQNASFEVMPCVRFGQNDQSHCPCPFCQFGNHELAFTGNKENTQQNGEENMPDSNLCENPDVLAFTGNKEYTPQNGEENMPDSNLYENPDVCELQPSLKDNVLMHVLKENSPDPYLFPMPEQKDISSSNLEDKNLENPKVQNRLGPDDSRFSASYCTNSDLDDDWMSLFYVNLDEVKQ